MARFSYGGQALIEGVLMRGRDAIAVALRHPDGRIVWSDERLGTGFRGTRWAKLPLVRGLVVLYETLVVGTRWLVRSAGVAAAEESSPATTPDGRPADAADLGKASIALMLVLTLVIGLGLFFFLPLLIARFVAGAQPDIVERVVEGIAQVAIFLVYLALIGRTADVRRTFQYHGAEHMTIHALEAGDPLNVDAIRKYPTAHPRCGTEFLVVVILVSIIAFSIVGRQELPLMVASRLILIPVIAAVSYELLRFGARHRGNALVRALFEPGIWVQKITTKQPTDEMIEVAIVSMEQAMAADGEPLPAGSGTIARSPLVLAGAPPAPAAQA
ncbi:MAG TPA: DUF1385 domain-containing protein [Patescibacteria group bacterium]|nr:DUF1385 domain-containing protein [Patescibacteria group bacterium]